MCVCVCDLTGGRVLSTRGRRRRFGRSSPREGKKTLVKRGSVYESPPGSISSRDRRGSYDFFPFVRAITTDPDTTYSTETGTTISTANPDRNGRRSRSLKISTVGKPAARRTGTTLPPVSISLRCRAIISVGPSRRCYFFRPEFWAAVVTVLRTRVTTSVL